MTNEEWLSKVKQCERELAYLINTYHPARPRLKSSNLSITASTAERACEIVRRDIRENFEGDPLKEFITAMAHEDVKKIYNLLSDAWFGVPESTECWNLVGFKEAVDLMDDPPE